jgi:hypothetical protein
MDAVFAFSGGQDLHKSNLAAYRSRRQFTLPDGTVVFMKRYHRPPVSLQIRNWLSHGRRHCLALFDIAPGIDLAPAGISTPKVIAWGQEWSRGFEKRSFVMTRQLPDRAAALEKTLPACFESPSKASFRERKAFLKKLADFAQRFHETGYRHRDFYLAHIFMTAQESLYLIDLTRAFRPRLLSGRYRIKDLAQLHYSAPGRTIHCTDRLRFYKYYANCTTLSPSDKRLIRAVQTKAWKMAHHDIRHGRPVPFAK